MGTRLYPCYGKICLKSLQGFDEVAESIISLDLNGDPDIYLFWKDMFKESTRL